MKKIALIILCLITITVMHGCATGSEGGGGHGGSPHKQGCH